MQNQLEIDFEGLEHSDAVEKRIRDEVDKLEQFFDRITSARVVISKDHRRHTKGNLFDVRVLLHLPAGKVVSVDRTPRQDHAHEDLSVAIRDSFKAARRQLQDKKRKLQGKVKSHDNEMSSGQVLEVFPDEGYGFILSDGGREIYFHANSLKNHDFANAKPGVRVSFREEVGREGPQATITKIMGGPHAADAAGP